MIQVFVDDSRSWKDGAVSVDTKLARCLLSLTCLEDTEWELKVLRASHSGNLNSVHWSDGFSFF